MSRTIFNGSELARTDVNLPLDQNHWDLSPDGSQIAIVLASEREEGRIRILNLADASTHDVSVNGWTQFQSLDWSPGGQGWYISSRSALGANLLYVDLRGRTRVLRQQPGSFQTWGIPSHNGRHLAFLEWTSISNVWIVLSERHIRYVLKQYVEYFMKRRPHQGLKRQLPDSTEESPATGRIRCRQVLGGLINDYYREAA